MQKQLFPTEVEILAEGAVILRNFVGEDSPALFALIQKIAEHSPFRHMQTPGGFSMSVAMTNCGPLGWISDRQGYRYSPFDPRSGEAWPSMPPLFQHLATKAADVAGYSDFHPDACLINCYRPKARMTLHQDRDERDRNAPIVSVSLGLPATFLFGGKTRKDCPQRYLLTSGDVVVWGGPSRLNYHGVNSLPDGHHPLTGSVRYNLTFRMAE